MYDLKLDRSGDLEISDAGDVMLTQSVRQAVEIRLVAVRRMAFLTRGWGPIL